MSPVSWLRVCTEQQKWRAKRASKIWPSCEIIYFLLKERDSERGEKRKSFVKQIKNKKEISFLVFLFYLLLLFFFITMFCSCTGHRVSSPVDDSSAVFRRQKSQQVSLTRVLLGRCVLLLPWAECQTLGVGTSWGRDCALAQQSRKYAILGQSRRHRVAQVFLILVVRWNYCWASAIQIQKSETRIFFSSPFEF